MEHLELINDLTERTRKVLKQAQALQNLPVSKLNEKPQDNAWSALECLEHLNRYSRFYIPEISKQLDKGAVNINGKFKSNWLGNYFAKSMSPKTENLNKMKTFTSMNPIGSDVNIKVVDQFIEDQQAMLELLKKAKTKDLSKTKTAISISNWIRLRAGDTFRVVIYHNQRHLIQAMRSAGIWE